MAHLFGRLASFHNKVFVHWWSCELTVLRVSGFALVYDYSNKRRTNGIVTIVVEEWTRERIGIHNDARNAQPTQANEVHNGSDWRLSVWLSKLALEGSSQDWQRERTQLPSEGYPSVFARQMGHDANMPDPRKAKWDYPGKSAKVASDVGQSLRIHHQRPHGYFLSGQKIHRAIKTNFFSPRRHPDNGGLPNWIPDGRRCRFQIQTSFIFSQNNRFRSILCHID